MRSVLSISLPQEEKVKLEKRARKAGITISAYILYSVKVAENAISQEELLEMATEAEKDYRKGRTKELKSLADLM